MAKGFLYGNGGSNILNFKVVGGESAPASPRENTIWVNTDAEITEWAFAASQPTTRLDGSPLAGGEVWFKTSVSAAAPFNALKKNGVHAYPTSCRQYISGEWTAKIARTYQNGEWVEWDDYIYNNGIMNTEIGGGLTDSGWNYATNSSSDGTITNDGSKLVVKWATVSCSFGTIEKIDLTEYRTATLVYSLLKLAFSSVPNASRFVATPVKYTAPYSSQGALAAMTVIPYNNIGNNLSVSMDVSAVTGEWYVGATFYKGAATSVDGDAYVHQLILSK